MTPPIGRDTADRSLHTPAAADDADLRAPAPKRVRLEVQQLADLETKYVNLRERDLERSRIAADLKEAVTRGDWARIGRLAGGVAAAQIALGRAASEAFFATRDLEQKDDLVRLREAALRKAEDELLDAQLESAEARERLAGANAALSDCSAALVAARMGSTETHVERECE